MNQMLQDAITATRNGNKKEAQLLLAQNLQQNPDDAQSWYLLSLLVDSEEKRTTYLSKTLALNPNHEKAQTHLAQLQESDEVVAAEFDIETVTAMPVSTTPRDFDAQETGETLPDWLAPEADSLQLEHVGVIEVEEDTAVKETTIPQIDDDVPDWLQKDVSDSWVPEAEPATAEQEAPTAATPVESKEESPAPPPSKPAKKPLKKLKTKQQKQSQLNIMLVVLIITAVLITLALLLTLFNIL
ncbi:MAG: hypothetical protein GY796_15800 [Chloroflexi bacterium]|nr:hypothetical protein [Chloroflexota bacterium]